MGLFSHETPLTFAGKSCTTLVTNGPSWVPLSQATSSTNSFWIGSRHVATSSLDFLSRSSSPERTCVHVYFCIHTYQGICRLHQDYEGLCGLSRKMINKGPSFVLLMVRPSDVRFAGICQLMAILPCRRCSASATCGAWHVAPEVDFKAVDLESLGRPKVPVTSPRP